MTLPINEKHPVHTGFNQSDDLVKKFIKILQTNLCIQGHR
jgi:hypothetical protein